MATKEVAGIHTWETAPHHDLNTIKGIIYAPQLINKDMGWVTEAFEDRGSVSVSRLGQSMLLLITFDRLILPVRVMYGELPFNEK